MKKLLPILALSACTKVNDGIVPREDKERCYEQMDAVIEACEQADVIGTNDNAELYKAVDAVKACVNADIKIVCSQTDFVKIVTYKQ